MENCIKSNNDEVLKDFWMKYVASSFCCHDGNFIISHFSQISLFTSFLESFSKRREKSAIAILPSDRCIASKTGLFVNFFQSHDNEIIKVKCEAGRTIKILHFWLVHNVCMIRELLISWTLTCYLLVNCSHHKSMSLVHCPHHTDVSCPTFSP